MYKRIMYHVGLITFFTCFLMACVSSEVNTVKTDYLKKDLTSEWFKLSDSRDQGPSGVKLISLAKALNPEVKSKLEKFGKQPTFVKVCELAKNTYKYEFFMVFLENRVIWRINAETGAVEIAPLDVKLADQSTLYCPIELISEYNFVAFEKQKNIEKLARAPAEKAAAEKKIAEDLEREERLRKQKLEDERLDREQKLEKEREALEQKLAKEKTEREYKIYRAKILQEEENLKLQARKDEEEWNKLLIAQKKPVVFNDSTWVVLEAQNMGSVLKPRNSFGEEAKTEGVFILVKYQVVNTTKIEKRIIVEPVLVDSSLREFKTYDKQNSYFPVEGETLTFKALPASITRTCYGIYEVAKDSKEIVFRARSLETLTQDFKNIPLAFRKEK